MSGMLDRITPIILTYNEEPNLARTLSKLAWAREVVVVDSFSTDATLDIARQHERVRVVQRAFDDFATQLNFAVDQVTGTAWVMVLDADYVLSDELIAELAAHEPTPDETGFRCSFRYCMEGVPLRGSLYPSNIVVFRTDAGRYYNDGHAYRLALSHGRIVRLHGLIDHDDRKPFSRWLASQQRYAAQEAEKLSRARWKELPWQDRARLLPPLAATLVLPYCLVIKGGALDGRAGLVYAAQRVLAETVLSVELLRRKLR